MQITLNITEDSNVELVHNDECKAVQGECCITDLTFVFPETIKGIAIDEFTKHIEFGECKKYGECKKFLDKLEGDTYELNDVCTQFEKIMVQVVLTKGNVIWKSLPFMLEFHESINAEGDIVIQTQILHLQEIKDDWQAYIKAHTLRIIKRVGDIPTAEATSLGDVIFYLGANCESPYLMTYGHYYACNFANGVYEWTDLTQDPSLEDVANGVREISRNQTLQFWKNTAAEFKNEVPQENTLYLIEDEDKRALQHEILAEMAADPTYNLAYPIQTADNEKWLLFGGKKIPLLALFEDTMGVVVKETLYKNDSGLMISSDDTNPTTITIPLDRSKPAHLRLKMKVYDRDAGDPSEIIWVDTMVDSEAFFNGEKAYGGAAIMTTYGAVYNPLAETCKNGFFTLALRIEGTAAASVVEVLIFETNNVTLNFREGILYEVARIHED